MHFGVLGEVRALPAAPEGAQALEQTRASEPSPTGAEGESASPEAAAQGSTTTDAASLVTVVPESAALVTAGDSAQPANRAGATCEETAVGDASPGKPESDPPPDETLDVPSEAAPAAAAADGKGGCS